MKKDKHYFLRLAIIKTMALGITFLTMPILASIYHNFIGDKVFNSYFGYVVAAGIVLIIGNLILVFRAWVLAFDKTSRSQYLKED
tara:strand:+ start:1285 stop:1539 length:255 start_codon:yes stop_codon:yes gene_type:complete